MKSIETKYFGPTNFRGSRIRATDGDSAIWMSYSYEHATDENHKRAAERFAVRLGWKGKLISGHTKEGMVWVFLDECSPTIEL